MGRLFWKFFAAIWIAQLLGTMSVMFIVEAVYRIGDTGRLQKTADRSMALLIESAADTLRDGGIVALHMLVEKSAKQTLIVVDENQRDIFDRPVDPTTLRWARSRALQHAGADMIRQVNLPDGHNYLLFIRDATHQAAQNDLAPLPPHGAKLLPIEPLLAHLVASLVVAALLAHYLSKPIRSLRSAIQAVASGDLQVAAAYAVERRKDELADLLREFDHMANTVSTLVDGQRQLFHDVSHELRSPLARMQVAIGLAKQQPEKLTDLLDRMEGEVVHSDRLIGELLAVSRLTAAEVQMMDEEFPIDEVLSAIVDSARFEGKAKGQTVHYSGGAGVIIKGRAELMHRAVENVIRNAIEHTQNDSTIWVDARTDVDGGLLRISVFDTGPGITDTDSDHIFEAYLRAPIVHRSDGHGLGLSIARRVVEAHGGQIRAYNFPQYGLCVEIAVPVFRLDSH